MYSVGGSEAIARDMDSLLFSSNFRYPSQGEFAKSKELIYTGDHQTAPVTLQSSNLARYRSAPSSFFASLLNDGVDEVCENYHPNRETSNFEPEMMFPRFDSGEGETLDLKYQKNLKQEETESVNDFSVSVSASDMVYVTPSMNHTSSVTSASPSVENMAAGLNSSIGMENSNQLKKSRGGNCSNLIRQSSSPAGFLSNLAVDIGFGAMNNVENFGSSNRTNVEVSSTTSRLNNYMNYSTRPSCSRFMPQIPENVNDNITTSSQQNVHLASGQSGDHSNKLYPPRISNDPASNSLKRNRDGEVKISSNMNGQDSRNVDSNHYTSGLVHQLSLPSTSAEMATIENFLQFQQDSTPCKIRAKRGFATHPRSIAERVRRTRISERMKKLQDLFPNMDKQANTADMLDLAVEYIKDLQKEVQTLNETRARCTCSSERTQSSL